MFISDEIYSQQLKEYLSTRMLPTKGFRVLVQRFKGSDDLPPAHCFLHKYILFTGRTQTKAKIIRKMFLAIIQKKIDLRRALALIGFDHAGG